MEIQRNVHPQANDYSIVDDVALVGRSSKFTSVYLNALTVVRGRFASDLNGDREIRVLFHAGTTAKIARTPGDTASLSEMRLRLTEYTVGEDGSSSMPALLPPSSSYTYCIDFSVDEADSIGQSTAPHLPVPDVLFTNPVICYVRNFLDYPVGTAVPNGFYDRRSAKWVAVRDGWVVRILSDNGGTVTIDSNGDSLVDGQARLDSLGVTSAELQAMSAQYDAGDVLWRMPVDRFSNADYNVRYLPPPIGGPGPPRSDRHTPNPCEVPGSIINCEDRTLGQRLGVLGTPYSLNYRSFRAPGDKVMRSVRVPVVGSSIPIGLYRVHVELLVAGRRYHQIVPGPITLATPPVTMTWDGRDAYDREVTSSVVARVGVGYEYRRWVVGGTGSESLGDPAASGTALGEATLLRQIPVIAWSWQSMNLGAPSADNAGLGGWTLSPHHFYDNVGKGIVYLGDGSVIDGEQLTPIVRRYNDPDDCPGGAPSATVATLKLDDSRALAYGPRGELYVGDDCRNSVLRVDPNGTVTRIAGNGNPGSYQGDGSATATALPHQINGLAVGPDGSVYLAAGRSSEPDEAIVAVVTPGGMIRKIIGGKPGETEGGGDGLPASEAWVGYVGDIALGPDGSLFVSNGRYGYNYGAVGNIRIRRIGPNGIIRNYAGNGLGNSNDSTGAATSLSIMYGLDIAADGEGNLYINEKGRIKRVSPDGMLSTIAMESDVPGDRIHTLTANARGMLLFSSVMNDETRWYFMKREPDGTLSQLGFTSPFSGLSDATSGGVPFLSLRGFDVQAIAIAPDETFAWSRHVGLYTVRNPFAGEGTPEVVVASADGSEYYVFARNGTTAGRHLYTRDAMTGAVRHEFGYDAAGRLSTIRDVNGLTTKIQRGGTGAPIGILAPFGQRTRLTVDSNGRLESVEDTLGNAIELTTRSDGLLETFTDPRGNVHTFTWGADGRLWEDEGPPGTGVSEQLAVSYDGLKRTVTRTTGAGVMTTYDVTELLNSTRQREITTAGLRYVRTDSSDMRVLASWPDGGSSVDSVRADPRFGFVAPYSRRSRVRLPNGMTRVVERQRGMSTLFNPPFTHGEWAENDSVNGDSAHRVEFHSDSLIVRMRSPRGRTATVTLDSAGRPLTMTVPGLAPWIYHYEQGRLERSTQGGRGLRYGYDARGRLAVVRDTSGIMTTLSYDTADRLTSVKLPGNRDVGLEPDASSNLMGVTPPGPHEHQFEYTPTDLVDKYRPPPMGLPHSLTQYAYNSDRQLMRIYRPDGKNVALAFGAGGTVDSVTIARGKFTASYSSAGQLASLTSPDSVFLTFGNYGPVDTSEIWTGHVTDTVSFALNRDLRVSSQRVNGANMVAYSYDSDGLLEGVGALAIARRLDNGLISGTTLGNVTTSESYSWQGDLWRRTASYSATPFYDAIYTRDSVGRITGVTETISGTTKVINYVYSDSGFLVRVTVNGTVTERYGYDGNGNRVRYDAPGDSATMTVDGQDRMLRYRNTTFTYSAGGDLQSQAFSTPSLYTYDALGNLLKVKLASGDSTEYMVDGRNRRVVRKRNGVVTHRWIYQDQLEPVAEFDGNGNLAARYVYGTRAHVPDYVVKGGTTYRIISDHLGSVRLVVNASTGSIAQRLDYDSYGRVTDDSAPGFQCFGYAGGLWDGQTDLVRFGARDYDPNFGRWTTKDPIRFAGGDVNLYAYVGNNPVNAIDPYGTDWIDVIDGPAMWLDRHDWDDYFAGVGDAVSGVPFTDWSATKWARESFEVQDEIDPCGGAYGRGQWTGVAIGLMDFHPRWGGRFGKSGMGNPGGIFNRNRWFRVGWGWDASRGLGHPTFRVAIGSGKGGWWRHPIDIPVPRWWPGYK